MTEKSFSKRDIENIQAILKFCEDIEYFIQLYGSSEMDFQESLPLQYGCSFSLIQIGEHVKRLSSEVRDEYPDIDWRGAAGLRDIITHDYARIDTRRVRSSILTRVPPLADVCRFILSRLS